MRLIAQNRIVCCLRILLAFFLALFLCVPSGVLNAWADEPAGEEAADDGESSGGDKGGKDESSKDDGSDDQKVEKNYVTELLLKWSSDYNGENEFVGKGHPIKKVEIESKGQLVQLNGYYLDNSGSGVVLETASSSTDLGAIDLTWKSSNTKVATVSPTGLVTPIKNGTCTITASVKNSDKYGEASASVDFVISGQNGNYVSDVEITDEKGKIITQTVVLEGDGAKPVYQQLYAKITWSDPDGNVVKTESTKSKKCTATYTWATAGNTDTVTVNKSTGRVASQESGIGQVVVTVSGGKGGKSVSDTIYVRVDTGQYDYNPADSLTLNVSYEEYPDQIVETVTYSAAELESKLSQVTNNYTVIGSNGFATIRATGFMFKDVLKLLNCSMNDIKQFRFGTADSYDSPVSYSYLFGSNRYYFPDYDIGYTTDGVIVPPVIATANSIHWNESYISPDEELDTGTRYRLVFGVSGTTDSNTSKQIYYINTINVILKGAPPTSNGDGDGDGDGNGNGSGMGSGSSSGDGDSGGGEGANDSSATAGGAGTGSDNDSGTKWRIYQMMSTNESNPGVLEMENPLAPFALPIGIAAFLLGGLSFYLEFRRRRYQ